MKMLLLYSLDLTPFWLAFKFCLTFYDVPMFHLIHFHLKYIKSWDRNSARLQPNRIVSGSKPPDDKGLIGVQVKIKSSSPNKQNKRRRVESVNQMLMRVCQPLMESLNQALKFKAECNEGFPHERLPALQYFEM